MAPLCLRFPLFGQDAPGNLLNVALIGCGNQGIDADLKSLLTTGQNLVAVCDVDERQAQKALAGLSGAKVYTDYRQLLDREKTLDAAIIATPDHWHAPICRAFMQAGKHVYCEKPLTRTIGEARELATLSRASKSVTQMGNQGSAFLPLRRSIEAIQAGVLGTIQDIYIISPREKYATGIDRPPGEDPIPAGLNWDFWVGPSPLRPFKTKIYHPYLWRGWYDFGTGQLGNWGCHIMNLPFRALKLGLPTRVEIDGTGLGHESYWTGGEVTYHFDSSQGPVRIYWQENRPRPAAFDDIAALHGEKNLDGLVIVGSKGQIYTDSHNGGALLKLTGEARFRDVLHHEAVKGLPITLPRAHGHMQEWVDACKGGPATFSGFEIASRLTEISLMGVVPLRLGRSVDYSPEGDVLHEPLGAALINGEERKKWL
jgi:hypothetical protein